MKIGYARVSKKDQNLEPQIDQLPKAECAMIFQEIISEVKKKDRNWRR